jgi:beta-lactam-binding protein with PASTA domain
VVVPEFVGQRVGQLWHVAARAGVKLDIERRTEHPPPVDGRVVEQSPAPGTVVRRNSAVHLSVVHEVEAT